MGVPSWSYSKLSDFEKCKKYFWLKHDQKIPEPERELRPGQLEHANDRGTRLHTNAELFINGTEPDLDPANDKHFGYNMEFLRELYTEGLVSLEGEWGMNRQWEPCGWNGDWIECVHPNQYLGRVVITAKVLPERGKVSQLVKIGKATYEWVPSWLRLKLDAMVMHSDTSATVIDFKSGKKFGNEIKHAEQLQLYQLVTFLRYPKLETVRSELWYLDQGEITAQTFTRKQGLMFKTNFERRGHAQTTAEDFPANPSRFACQWCPYKPTGTGHCSVGV